MAPRRPKMGPRWGQDEPPEATSCNKGFRVRGRNGFSPEGGCFPKASILQCVRAHFRTSRGKLDVSDFNTPHRPPLHHPNLSCKMACVFLKLVPRWLETASRWLQMASRSAKTPQDDSEMASRGSKMAPKLVLSPPRSFKNTNFYYGKLTFLDISSRWLESGPRGFKIGQMPVFGPKPVENA